MKVAALSQLLSAWLLASAASATPFSNDAALVALKRATEQSPNGYAPSKVDCPANRPSVRYASGLSDSESKWLQQRRPKAISAMRDFVARLSIPNFDARTYFDDHTNNSTVLPNLGIAMSGGGYRALLNGGGALAAFDSRTPNATAKGQLGGLLQSATYLSGLSGGSWLVGSLYLNNFTSVQALLDSGYDRSGSLWEFERGILKGPETRGLQILTQAQYYKNLFDTVEAKKDAGFDVSLTDYWSRALSFQFVNASSGGPGFTWSSISEDAEFAAANVPMPIVVADGRAPGERIISLNTTVFEFNPWELGSWDPTLYGFAPLRHIGSKFEAGVVPSSESCVIGFDNAAYVIGTSSSLFNTLLTNFNQVSALVPDFLQGAIKAVLTGLSIGNDDIADYSPNPFFHFNNRSNPSANTERLTLVDGGEDGQNIPLHPLIQPVRAVDIIFAVDSSADTAAPGANWPNGTAIIATFERTRNETMQNGTSFPAIPDANTFINQGLNTRPTFFGCNATNTTNPSPLIVYIPNTPYVFFSNVSTFDPDYTNSERDLIVQNGYNVATMGNGTVDSNWSTCVGCAIMSRSFTRTGTQVPAACQQCFTRYCWDGSLNSSTPAPFTPSPLLGDIKATNGVGKLSSSSGLAMAVAAIAGSVLALGI